MTYISTLAKLLPKQLHEAAHGLQLLLIAWPASHVFLLNNLVCLKACEDGFDQNSFLFCVTVKLDLCLDPEVDQVKGPTTRGISNTLCVWAAWC